MSDEAAGSAPPGGPSVAESESAAQTRPMGVEDLLDVLRAAVARLPREATPIIRDEPW